jgi:hypothetical protein
VPIRSTRVCTITRGVTRAPGIEAGISGLDSPLGIAGALVLEGGVHRWRQLRMTETSRYPLRHQTRPERARCDGFDRFYEIHLFKTA